MPKSPDAFRTISEVADWLGVQAHVLRFWESKFSQVKPIKRAGGRRYYRPADMLLLGGIKKLLHDDGMTIKGAQKLLRENGTAYVADFSQPLDDLTVAVIEGTAEDVTDQIEAEAAAVSGHDEAAAPEMEIGAFAEAHAEDDPTDVPSEEPNKDDADQAAPVAEDERAVDAAPDGAAEDQTATAPETEIKEDTSPPPDPAPVSEIASGPAFAEPNEKPAEPETTQDEEPPQPAPVEAVSEPHEPAATPQDTPAKPEKFEVTPPKPRPAAKPRVIDVGPLPDLADFPDQPSVLSSIAAVKTLSPEDAAAIQPLLARLTRLSASMANPRKDMGKD